MYLYTYTSTHCRVFHNIKRYIKKILNNEKSEKANEGGKHIIFDIMISVGLGLRGGGESLVFPISAVVV